MVKKNKDILKGSGITLTNKEKKDVIEIIRSLENGGVLLKGTTRKITSQEGEFLNCLRPLITAGLSLTKSVLILLGLKAAVPATDAAIQNKIFGSGTTALITSNREKS